MTVAKTLAFEEFYLEFDDGAGNYTRYAGLTTKSLKRTSALSTAEVPDADDEGLPCTVFNGVKSITEQFTGTLTAIPKDLQFYLNWQQTSTAKNVKFHISKTQAQGGGHWVTSYILESFELTGETASEALTANITLTATGKLGTFVAGDDSDMSTRVLPLNNN